jgi:hypothetical protein
MKTEDLVKEFGNKMNELQGDLNALISTYSIEQQKEFNAWFSKCQAILKLPLQDQQEALKKLQDEFKHYKPKI